MASVHVLAVLDTQGNHVYYQVDDDTYTFFYADNAKNVPANILGALWQCRQQFADYINRPVDDITDIPALRQYLQQYLQTQQHPAHEKSQLVRAGVLDLSLAGVYIATDDAGLATWLQNHDHRIVGRSKIFP